MKLIVLGLTIAHAPIPLCQAAQAISEGAPIRGNKLYPGYAKSVLNERLVAWPEIQYSLAGYSCPAPGDVTTKAKFLSEPFNRRLFFAGEHTCIPFFGYMEGALQSGLYSAIKVLKGHW